MNSRLEQPFRVDLAVSPGGIDQTLRIIPSDSYVHEANAVLNTKSPNHITRSTQLTFACRYHQGEHIRHFKLGAEPRASA
jgi:hypothetical protein